MKKALNLTVLSGQGITQTQAVPMVARAGFDGCFWVAEDGVQVADVARLAHQHGLAMEFIHAPVSGVNTIWMEGEEGQRRLDILIGWMRQCAQAQLPYMVSHVWTTFTPIEPNALGFDRFGRLLDLAEQEGVKIAFENAEIDLFLSAVWAQFHSHPAAGFCFDSGHELCYNGGRDQLAQFGDKLLCTHLHDNMGQTGPEITSRDDSHMMPFDGRIDWEDVAHRLKKVGWEGTLTFELKMQNKPDRHTHDRYAHLSPEGILDLAFQKAKQFEALMQ